MNCKWTFLLLRPCMLTAKDKAMVYGPCAGFTRHTFFPSSVLIA